MTARTLLFTTFFLAACGSELEDQIDEAADAVLGRASTDGSCAAQYRPLLEKSLRMARSVATTPAFQQCLDQTIRAQTTLSSNIIKGPYRACAGDPYATSSVSMQVTRALAFGRSSNALQYRCQTLADPNWGAQADLEEVGSAAETFTFNQSLVDPWFSQSGPTNDPFWYPHRMIAETAWHEAMHQHNYNHGSAAECGQSSTYDMYMQSMPYMVGGCMNEIFVQSAEHCGNMDQCGPTATPVVTGMGVTSCSCVYDPAPLAAPRISATGMPGAVVVSWPRVQGAAGYRISSGTDGNSFPWSWTSFACNDTTCDSIDPQTWGDLYYSVTALNGPLVESPRSNVVNSRGWINLSHASGVSASQSSTFPEHSEAWRAIDGNRDGDWNHGSVTATGWNLGEYWQIDLGAVRTVRQLDLLSRTDWGGDYLQQFDIYTSNQTCAWNNTCSWGPSRASQDAYAGPKTTLTVSRGARYLRLKLRPRTDLGNPPPGASVMLTEVDIWGN